MKCSTAYLLAVLSVLAGPAAAGDAPFSVTIIDVAEQAPVGSAPSIAVEIVNRSGNAVPLSLLTARTGMEVLESPGCTGSTHHQTPDAEDGQGVFSRPEDLDSTAVPAGWAFRTRLYVRPCAAGEYTVRAYFEGRRDPRPCWDGSVEPWTGKVYSTQATLRAVQPIGVDAEAFAHLVKQVDENGKDDIRRFGDAFLYVEDARSQLLRLFPESTYAADQILTYCGRKPWQDNDRLMASLEEGGLRASNSVPCDHEECAKYAWESLSGEAYWKWQAKWFVFVLEHHPDIWYADDLRFHLALCHLMLGQTADAAAGLEVLAKKEGSAWAPKCRDLLVRLREKKMLE